MLCKFLRKYRSKCHNSCALRAHKNPSNQTFLFASTIRKTNPSGKKLSGDLYIEILKKAATLPVAPKGSALTSNKMKSLVPAFEVATRMRARSSLQIPNCLYALFKSIVFTLCLHESNEYARGAAMSSMPKIFNRSCKPVVWFPGLVVRKGRRNFVGPLSKEPSKDG